MLRERVAQYEKLLHGLHAVAAQAVDAAAECQKRIDAAEILIEDGRPGGARPADKLAPSLARYTAVLPHCTAMITGPPPPPVPPAIEWAAAAASRRGRRIGGGQRADGGGRCVRCGACDGGRDGRGGDGGDGGPAGRRGD